MKRTDVAVWGGNESEGKRPRADEKKQPTLLKKEKIWTWTNNFWPRGFSFGLACGFVSLLIRFSFIRTG